MKVQNLYTLRWQQEYALWPEPKLDLTQARKVLARIIAL